MPPDSVPLIRPELHAHLRNPKGSGLAGAESGVPFCSLDRRSDAATIFSFKHGQDRNTHLLALLIFHICFYPNSPIAAANTGRHSHEETSSFGATEVGNATVATKCRRHPLPSSSSDVRGPDGRRNSFPTNSFVCWWRVQKGGSMNVVQICRGGVGGP